MANGHGCIVGAAPVAELQKLEVVMNIIGMILDLAIEIEGAFAPPGNGSKVPLVHHLDRMVMGIPREEIKYGYVTSEGVQLVELHM